MVDMTNFFTDPFAQPVVPIPLRLPTPAVTAARGADYYDAAALKAAQQGQKDVATALASEGQKLSISSWLSSDNPLNTQDGSLNPFAAKVGDTGMTLQTKLMIGAAIVAALLIATRRR